MNTPDAATFSLALMAASFALAFGAFFAGKFALRICRGFPSRPKALTAAAATLAAVLCWQEGQPAWAGTLCAAAALVAAGELGSWIQMLVSEDSHNDLPIFAVWASASLAFFVLPLLGNAEKPLVLAIVFLGAFVGAYFTDMDGEPNTAAAGVA